MTDSTSFSPTWASPPGDTIADILEERGWNQAEFARRTGFTRKHINDLVQGRMPITPDAAERLHHVLGSTTEFWLMREAQFQAAKVRRAARAALAKDAGWLMEVPVAWIQKRGWIPSARSKPDQVHSLLGWFGVASVPAWRETFTKPLTAFRSSTRIAKVDGAVATWLRAAEIAAASIACQPFSLDAFRAALPILRSLTTEADLDVVIHEVQAICASAGVAVLFVEAPPGCPVHGATRWLTPTKALLALSFRYRSNDQLWFSLFHEAAHLLKHGKKLLFIEGYDGLDEDKEGEANRFAADLLIASSALARLRACRSAAQFVALAAELGVAPGILVGRAQHEGWIARSHLNGLKVFYGPPPDGATSRALRDSANA